MPRRSAWRDTAARHKGVDPASGWVADDWLSGPWAFLQGVTSLLTMLHRVHKGVDPVPARAVRARADGRTVVSVFPVTVSDKLLFSGYGADVWMQDGVTPEQARAEAARMYRGTGYEQPGVSLVLGAGNVATITALDVLHMLYHEGHVALVKMNPVNDYMGRTSTSASSATTSRAAGCGSCTAGRMWAATSRTTTASTRST